MGGKIGVLVIVEGNGDLSSVAKDVAMHVAAINPQFVKLSDVPAEFIANEKHIQLEAAKNDPKLANKPEKILEGIINGKVNKKLLPTPSINNNIISSRNTFDTCILNLINNINFYE